MKCVTFPLVHSQSLSASMQLGEEYTEQIYLPIEEWDRHFTLCQEEDIQMKLFEDIVSVDPEEVSLHLQFENTEHQCSTVCWNKHKESSQQAFCKSLTYLLTYLLLSYLLTPWSRVLLEKLTGSQLVKKFPPFTSACHLSLSRASSIQSIPPHPTSWICILILSSNLRLPSCLFPSGFHTKILYVPLLYPLRLHALPISFFSTLSPEKHWVISTDH